MENKGSQGWKGIIFQLIVVLLGSSLIATSIGGFYYEAVVKPKVEVQIVPNGDDPNNALIILSNHGQVPATHIKLIVTTPKDIIGNDTFSIENVTLKKINSRLLEIIMPRLVGGEGSITRINLLMNGKTRNYGNFAAYSVYDEGSSLGSMRNTPSNENFLRVFFTPGVLGIMGLAILLCLFIYSKYLKKRQGEQFALQKREAYDKIFMDYEKSEKAITNITECLIGLELIKTNVENSYNKGYISQSKYCELDKAINERIVYVISSTNSICELIKNFNEKIIEGLNISECLRIYRKLNEYVNK